MSIRQNPDYLLLDAVKKRLIAEAEHQNGGSHFWALLVASDGRQRVLKSSDDLPPPCADQLMFAQDMGPALNRNFHHDGSWIICFTDPVRDPIALDQWTQFSRLVFLWLDKDADPQFSIEIDDNFADVLMKGPDYWFGEAERHWETWRFHMREVLDPKARALATFRRSLGERAPSDGRTH